MMNNGADFNPNFDPNALQNAYFQGFQMNPQLFYPGNDINSLINNQNLMNTQGYMGVTPNFLGANEQDINQINYYQESCKLYIANVVLTTQMKELVAEKNELLARISKLEKKGNNSLNQLGIDSLEEKKKRHRRTASEIDRHYKCPVQICSKNYGSEGSLVQHVKLKHSEFYQKNYQYLAQLASINPEEFQSKGQQASTQQNQQTDLNSNNTNKQLNSQKQKTGNNKLEKQT